MRTRAPIIQYHHSHQQDHCRWTVRTSSSYSIHILTIYYRLQTLFVFGITSAIFDLILCVTTMRANITLQYCSSCPRSAPTDLIALRVFLKTKCSIRSIVTVNSYHLYASALNSKSKMWLFYCCMCTSL